MNDQHLPTQHGTTPQGGRYIQSSGISATNPKPSIQLPAQPVTVIPATVKLDDGAEVDVTAYKEDRSVMSFKRSEIRRMTPEVYAAYEDRILQAQTLGLIEDDTISSEERVRRNNALNAKAGEYKRLYDLKQARTAEDSAFKHLNASRDMLEHAKRFEDAAGIEVAEARVNKASSAFDNATVARKELEAQVSDAS